MDRQPEVSPSCVATCVLFEARPLVVTSVLMNILPVVSGEADDGGRRVVAIEPDGRLRCAVRRQVASARWAMTRGAGVRVAQAAAVRRVAGASSSYSCLAGR